MIDCRDEKLSLTDLNVIFADLIGIQIYNLLNNHKNAGEYLIFKQEIIDLLDSINMKSDKVLINYGKGYGKTVSRRFTEIEKKYKIKK